MHTPTHKHAHSVCMYTYFKHLCSIINS